MVRRVLRRYPLQTPRARILNWMPPVPSSFEPFRIRDGTIAALPAGRDHVSLSLYWLGQFDPWVADTLRLLARPGDLALDIGANVGAMALTLAAAVGPTGRVFAFEPVPATAELLRANVDANPSKPVDVFPIALSDAAGARTLFTPDGHPGLAALGASPTADSRPGSTVDVRAETLDGWLADHPDV